MKYKCICFRYVLIPAILVAFIFAIAFPVNAETKSGMGFMRNNNSTFGEYVNFQVNNTGAIIDYGIAGNLIFDSVSIKDFSFDRYYVIGTVARVENKDRSALLQVHDNPAAVIKILTSKPMTITFDAAEGVRASNIDGGIELDSGNIKAYITGTPGTILTIEDGLVTADAPAFGAVFMRAVPVNMHVDIPVTGSLNRITAVEIGRKRVGAEIAIGSGGKYNIVNYTGLQMRLEMIDNDRIRIRLNSSEKEGQVVVINLDNTTLSSREQDRLRIKFDDMLMTCVDNPEEVFKGTTKPLCWLYQQEVKKAFGMVYTGNFSEHVIDIEVEKAAGTPSSASSNPAAQKAPAFEFMATAIVLVLMAALKRKYRPGRSMFFSISSSPGN